MRHAERNGVKRRRARSDETELGSNRWDRYRDDITYLSSGEFLSPPWWRCSFPSFSREEVRPGSLLERMPGPGATHQLLSGQLGRSPTPMVSYLCDGSDRGFRPF